MLLQEKQLSVFLPIRVEFSRFSDGSKLNSSPQCPSPFSLSDGAKISIIFETTKKKEEKKNGWDLAMQRWGPADVFLKKSLIFSILLTPTHNYLIIRRERGASNSNRV